MAGGALVTDVPTAARAPKNDRSTFPGDTVFGGSTSCTFALV